MLVFVLLFCVGLGFLIRYFINSSSESNKKEKIREEEINMLFLQKNKEEVMQLKLPQYVFDVYTKKIAPDFPVNSWKAPITFSYLKDEELKCYELHNRIVPFIEDYTIYAYDKKADSFLEFHPEDSKSFDDYPKQNWQQFITNLFYDWYWNFYFENEDQEDLIMIKNAANHLEYKYFEKLSSLLKESVELDLDEVERKIEKLKDIMV